MVRRHFVGTYLKRNSHLSSLSIQSTNSKVPSSSGLIKATALQIHLFINFTAAPCGINQYLA